MSAPGSRLARQMRSHLWARGAVGRVCRACESALQVGWLRAFVPESGVLRCVGTLDGAPRAPTLEGGI